LDKYKELTQLLKRMEEQSSSGLGLRPAMLVSSLTLIYQILEEYRHSISMLSYRTDQEKLGIEVHLLVMKILAESRILSAESSVKNASTPLPLPGVSQGLTLGQLMDNILECSNLVPGSTISLDTNSEGCLTIGLTLPSHMKPGSRKAGITGRIASQDEDK